MRWPALLGAAAVLSLGVSAGRAHAQAEPLTAGARVRVGVLGGAPALGTVVGLRPSGSPARRGSVLAWGDALRVRRASTPAADTTIVLGPATTVERSVGGRRRPGRGALLGALAATALGIASVARCRDGGEGPPCALGYTTVPLLAVGGAFVGAALGAVLPVWPERWHSVPIQRTERR